MAKTIGIIGGMGPLATADLFRKIILITDASCDQEHIPVLIDSNTRIPDRTAAILHGGADPLPEMTASARRLEAAGADLLIMPCNTAHYFYKEVAASVGIPVLHMIRETADLVLAKSYQKVGLLATDGTCQAGVYQQIFDEKGIEIVKPEGRHQQAVMEVIYDGVKKANLALDLTAFYETMDDLFARGAQVLILGCTELPVAFDFFHIDRPAIDPTRVLAAAAVRAAGAAPKPEELP